MAPYFQVLNGVTVLHEGGGLMREQPGVNTHKYVETV